MSAIADEKPRTSRPSQRGSAWYALFDDAWVERATSWTERQRMMKNLESRRWNTAIAFYAMLGLQCILFLLASLELWLRRGAPPAAPPYVLLALPMLPLLMAGFAYYHLETKSVLLRLIDRLDKPSGDSAAD